VLNLACSSAPTPEAPSADAGPIQDAAVGTSPIDAGLDDATDDVAVTDADAQSAVSDAQTEADAPGEKPGKTCASAEALNPMLDGPTLSIAQRSTVGFVDNYKAALGTRCVYAEGPDCVYSVQVPAGATLDVRLRPVGSSLSTCCQVTRRRASTPSQPGFVIIDGFNSARPGGNFDLETEISNVPCP
jgi:hypothetical protein